MANLRVHKTGSWMGSMYIYIYGNKLNGKYIYIMESWMVDVKKNLWHFVIEQTILERVEQIETRNSNNAPSNLGNGQLESDCNRGTGQELKAHGIYCRWTKTILELNNKNKTKHYFSSSSSSSSSRSSSRSGSGSIWRGYNELFLKLIIDRVL